MNAKMTRPPPSPRPLPPTTHPVLFALQQVHRAGALNVGQKPHRMRAQQSLDVAQVARRTGRVAGVLAERLIRRQHVNAAAGRGGRLRMVITTIMTIIASRMAVLGAFARALVPQSNPPRSHRNWAAAAAAADGRRRPASYVWVWMLLLLLLS